jgi:alpha-galactosidase
MQMMQSLLRDERQVFSVNVPNAGSVPGLPSDAILEMPAAAGAAGFSPLQSRALPSALTAKLLAKIAAVEVTVQAALSGSFDLFVEALLTDGSVTEPDAAAALARDLIAVHQPYLPQFA